MTHDYQKEFNLFLETNIQTNSDICLYTIVDRKNFILDIFLKYYSNFPFDTFVFVRDNSDSNLISYINSKNSKFRCINVTNYTVDYRHVVYDDAPTFVKFFYAVNEKFLSSYKTVVNVDVDELLLSENLIETLNKSTGNMVSIGYDLIQNLPLERDINYSKHIFQQRNFVHKSSWFNKKVVYKNYEYLQNSGRHHMNTVNSPLTTLNMSKVCLYVFLENNKFNRKYYKIIPNNFNAVDIESVSKFYQNNLLSNLETMPEFIREQLKKFKI